MRTLLVSADLTADEIPVTSGHRRFDPDQGDDPLNGSRGRSPLVRGLGAAQAPVSLPFTTRLLLLAQLNHELSAGDKSVHPASLNLEISFGPGLPPGLR